LTGIREFKTQDLSLEALNKSGNLVQIFASEDKLNSLRAANRKEFGLTIKVLETNTKE
jgi:hypothetical protein